MVHMWAAPASCKGLGGLTANIEVQYLHLRIEDDHPTQIIAKVAMMANHIFILKFSH